MDRRKYNRLSNSSVILGYYNEFVLLRHEFSEMYPMLHPDEIFRSEWKWVLSELQIKREKELIQENISEYVSDQRNKRNN